MEAMHLNEDVYPDAKKFIPERFLENKKSMFAAANGRLEERDHYNFGWGRRICPGIHLVSVYISTFIAMLLIHSFSMVIYPG
jgi:cytochrome P450